MCFFHLILWNIISLGEVTFSNGKLGGELFGPHFYLVRTIGLNCQCRLMFYTSTYPGFHVRRSPSKTSPYSRDSVTSISVGFQGYWGEYHEVCAGQEVSWVLLKLQLRSSLQALTLDPSHAGYSSLNHTSTLPRVSHLPGPSSKELGRCAKWCVDYPSSYLLTLLTFYFSTVLDHQIPKRAALNSSFKVSFLL